MIQGAIPLWWLKEHVDLLLDLAGKFDEGSKMREATARRADCIMDMVKAWQEAGRPQ